MSTMESENVIFYIFFHPHSPIPEGLKSSTQNIESLQIIKLNFNKQHDMDP